MADSDGAMASVQAAVRGALTRLAWIPTALTITLPVVAALLFALKNEMPPPWDWVWLGLGGAALLLNGLVQCAVAWWSKQNEGAEIEEANLLRVALRDALQPVAEIIGAMPNARKSERVSLLKAAATQAVSALILLMKDVERARAIVYALDVGGTSMSPLAHHGRGSTPLPFTAGNVRGDRALALVAHGGHLFVADLDKEKPREWKGSGSDYRTFITAAITNGQFSFGMVTLDAPHADDLGENDKHLVLLVADLLAIAFAEADR